MHDTCVLHRCIVVDDMSSDSTAETARQATQNDERFEVVVNSKRKGAAHNLYTQLQRQDLEIEDDDVIVVLDGDDWLADSHVLSYLDGSVYSNKSCWMSYGSLVYFPVRSTRTRREMLSDACVLSHVDLGMCSHSLESESVGNVCQLCYSLVRACRKTHVQESRACPTFNAHASRTRRIRTCTSTSTRTLMGGKMQI